MPKTIITTIKNIQYKLIITGSSDIKYCALNSDCRLGKLSFKEKNGQA